MYIKQQWNDCCNYFDLRREGGKEREGQRRKKFFLGIRQTSLCLVFVSFTVILVFYIQLFYLF